MSGISINLLYQNLFAKPLSLKVNVYIEDKKSKLDNIIQSNKESDSIIANIQNENKKLNNKNLNFITNYKLVKVKTKK